jgi:hypothetical protein
MAVGPCPVMLPNRGSRGCPGPISIAGPVSTTFVAQRAPAKPVVETSLPSPSCSNMPAPALKSPTTTVHIGVKSTPQTCFTVSAALVVIGPSGACSPMTQRPLGHPLTSPPSIPLGAGGVTRAATNARALVLSFPRHPPLDWWTVKPGMRVRDTPSEPCSGPGRHIPLT